VPAWRATPIDEEAAAAVAASLGVRPLTARVLVGRGHSDLAAAGRFLAPRLGDLRPPNGVADLDRALDRLAAALDRGETVGVFGDYDVDGVTTAAVLTLALRSLGGRVIPRVASRFSGYGLGPDDAARFADEGCTVLVTGDCGTSDHDALALCRARGTDVIVIDHHQVPSGPTSAYALINPHRPDDHFPFKGLASCGVAFYLAAALRTRLKGRGAALAETFDPRALLDLVALGTLADMVPLVHENRILVSAGLRELASRRRPGLRVLAELAELDEGAPITSDGVGRLTPRLNAPGRLGEARPALELLLAAAESDARTFAAAIEDKNRERQRIQNEVWEHALAAASAAADAGDPAIVVGGEGWHPGVVGIVAARLVDRFGRPAVVVGFRDGVGRGSGRTPRGFDLHRAFEACREHLVVCGGHAAAAGLTVRAEAFAAFRDAFLAHASARAAPTAETAAAEVDAVAELRDLDLRQAEELARLEPFGMANSQPVLALPGVVVRARRVVGAGHLQLTLERDGAVGDAIAFGMADADPGEGAAVDVIGCAEVDVWRGVRRLRLRVKRLVKA
jgi:single-stranded-DNA-specific exonuclease